VQSGYSNYLSVLKTDALKAEADEQGNLKGTLEEYVAIKEQNSEDTRGRLFSFANIAI
jgi:ADP-ribose pyrophosphatase YjhB (NUDIX family)